jgi:hypothetical protein
LGLSGLPWAGRFWDVPEEGIANAWHFGQLHKKYGPIYVSNLQTPLLDDD